MTQMTEESILARFHAVLVEEIRDQRPEYVSGPFTVAEIYQNLVPYGSHRDRIGVEMNADYEDALLRLLAGEGGYLVLDSDAALRNLREELDSSNPNTGLYRDYAAVDVRLNPQMVDGAPAAAPASAPADEPEEVTLSVADLAPPAEEPEMIEPMEPMVEPEATATPQEAAPAADGDACRWCRAELPHRENLNFCPFCGSDLRVIPCRSCGEELEPEWRFCPSCGTEAAG